MKIILAVIFASTCCYGYRILGMFPFPGKSHHKVWDPLLAGLAAKGHQVTAVKGVKMDNPPLENYKEIFINITYPALLSSTANDDAFEKPSFLKQTAINLFYKYVGLELGEQWMNNPAFQEVINSEESYDAVLHETSFMQEYLVAFQHKFQAVGIEVITIGNHYWTYWSFGNPTDTSYIPEAHLVYTDRMSFLERLHLTVHALLMNLVWSNYYLPQYQALMDKHIRYPGWENRPSMVNMLSNTSLVLMNTDEALSYPHPLSPHFVEVGGINVVPNKPLPKDLQEFMDGAKDGVIFFSLGSHIQGSTTFGDSLQRVFTQIFSKLKQRVIWKWEKEFKNAPPNVKIGKWFPQQDILAHTNLRLFISHGGFQSATESIHYGTPMVVIPMIGDQDKNANFIESRGMGLHLAFANLTHESVEWAINEVLFDPRYKEKAKQQSMLLRDKTMSPLDTAIYWTEYVIRHKGAAHLRPAIATMPWYQQAMIDVYSALAAVILIPLYVIYKLISCFCRCLCGKNKRNVTTAKKKKN